ncbi:MAG: hypothetical protein ACR2PT_16555 [Endozoicomonas sp.]
MFNGSSDVQLQGQVSGGLKNGQKFALLAEATFADDAKNPDSDKFGTDYSNSRLQYFHIFDPGYEAVPNVGLSLDYINTDTNVKNDLLAIGGVVAINPALTGGLLIFPQIAAMTGSMEIPGVTQKKDDLTGYSLALITARYIGENGAYVSVVPEYRDLSGDEIDMKSLTFKTALNVPLNDARSWWLNTRYEFSKTDLDVNGKALPGGGWQTEAWIGVRRYF